MRLNRNTRIGLTLVGAALLLLLVVRMFRGNNTPAEPQPLAANPATPAQPVALNTSGMSAVAATTIPPRSIITARMLEMRPVPQSDSQMARETYIGNPQTLLGTITGDKPLYKGKRLVQGDVIGHITDVGIAGALRPGTRAMFVPIANKTTLHDMVAIGDFVDVIGSFDGQESRNIASNVRVLAVDVFVGDFPQVKGGRRGDYRAEIPGGAPSPQAAPPADPNAPAGAPGQPTPTPTPAPEGPPPAKPDPAITLEVTPDQATAIALAQNASAALDFVLRPRPAISTTPETRVIALIKPRLAPYADRMKRNPGGNANANRAASSGGNNSGNASPRARNNRNEGPSYNLQPSMPEGPMIPPADPNLSGPSGPVAASAPETYQIPVYGDGKIARVDTVLKP